MNGTAKKTCTAIALALTVLPAAAVVAQTPEDITRTTTLGGDDRDEGNWGWLGLLGLAGLAGLKRRDRDEAAVRRQAAPR